MTAVILGGGVSGLSSAYYLLRNSCPFKKIILLEASDRVGGWVQTTKLDNGAIFEHGPRSMRVMKKPTALNSLSLATELGLSNDIIAVTRSHPGTQNRFIYLNKKLHKLPSSVKQILFKQEMFSKPLYKALWRERNVPKCEADDESIKSFFSRRLGSEFADYLLNPFLRGIFAGDISKLSVKSCLPDIYQLEQKHGSIVRAMFKTGKPEEDKENYALNDIKRSQEEKWALWSLRYGLSQLTDRLEEAITKIGGVEVIKSTPCKKLEFTDNTVKVHTDNDTIEADHVVSSILAQDLASLLSDQHKTLADSLVKIPSVTCIVVNLEYKNFMPKIEGFGHLLPSSEDSCVLGVIYDSCTFKQHDTGKYISTRYTVMLGGAWYDDLCDRLGDLKESTIQNFACQIMRDQLDIQLEPSEVIVSIHKNCIPQYLVGHSKIVNSIDNYLDNNNLPLSLVGSSYKGVSVNDCILNSKLEMKKICDKMEPPVQTLDKEKESAVG